MTKQDSEKPKKRNGAPLGNQRAVGNEGGRPTLYKPEYAEQVRKYCLLGATDKELAEFFDVHLDTIFEWVSVYPEFSESRKKGKEQADANVADRLYQRAMGYEHDEVDIKVVAGDIVKTPIRKIYAPDPTAAIFWLKNRQSAKWRDKTQQEITITPMKKLLEEIDGTALSIVKDS